jgi:ATP-dependent 26S proteasome regulatory subunit
MSALNLPGDPHELDALMRLWEREALLSNSGLLLESVTDTQEKNKEASLNYFLENINGPVVLWTLNKHAVNYRSTAVYDVTKPTTDEQHRIWNAALGKYSSQLNGQIDELTGYFDLNAQTIRSVSNQALNESTSADSLQTDLWQACKAQARPKLEDLADRVKPIATWSDLVLPQTQLNILKNVVVHVRHRRQVYDEWQFVRKAARGLGISALFSGPSGTGKTMAAEVLANELGLDLYIIDLSQVISKYIGETEKNLARVFDAAEEGGAILLFDEADAIFGKRSEVRDSHDRYANIEVSYLLQRMEAYRGLAVLTSNMKSAIDDAFLRRIRFVVNFPFPDTEQRAQIWQRIFPDALPKEDLDFGRLARLNVAGGNIRNIALQAAFFAAEEKTPVSMAQVLKGARNEYAKLEKPLTDDLGVKL